MIILEQAEEVMLSEIIDELDIPISERTLQRDLSQLQELGFLESIGFGRGSKWRLSKTIIKDDKRRQLV